MEYDNTNRGSIWPNEDKTPENPTWADFKGTLNVNGQEYWVSAWKRKPDANPKAPSLTFSIQPKESRGTTRGNPTEQPPAASGAAGDGFDEIPFMPVDWRAS